MKCCWLLLGLLCLPARGEWLSLCHGQPVPAATPDAQRLGHYLAVDETASLLRLSPEPAAAACAQREVGFGPQDVVWAGFAPRLAADVDRVALQGSEKEGRFLVGEIILPEPEAPPGPARKASPPLLGRLLRAGAPERSAWFWAPGLWLETPQRIFDSAQKLGLKRIYLTVPVAQNQVTQPQALRQFLRAAHARGVQVAAVLGDPRAVLRDGVKHFVASAAAYEAFNASGPAAEQLDGLQLDIELYLLPGYAQDPAAWLARYAAAVQSIHVAAPGLALDLVLPFWLDPHTPPAAPMLDEVAASIERVTVMDYRTDPDQVRQFASAFLQWGQKAGKVVQIALETLPIEPEMRRHYRAAPAGELWRLGLGDKTVLVLLRTARTPPPGVASYRASHTRQIDGTDISFFKHKDRLMEWLPALEQELAAWPSFSGLAIHGADQ